MYGWDRKGQGKERIDKIQQGSGVICIAMEIGACKKTRKGFRGGGGRRQGTMCIASKKKGKKGGNGERKGRGKIHPCHLPPGSHDLKINTPKGRVEVKLRTHAVGEKEGKKGGRAGGEPPLLFTSGKGVMRKKAKE